MNLTWNLSLTAYRLGFKALQNRPKLTEGWRQNEEEEERLFLKEKERG